MIFKDRFKDKIAIVTGAAQGIGKSVADQLKDQGLNVLAIIADLETYAGFGKVIEETQKHFKTVDVLINNVGGTIWAKPFQHYQEDEIIKEIIVRYFQQFGDAEPFYH